MLADLWNSPDAANTLGASTIGSSEACMLGGMAMNEIGASRIVVGLGVVTMTAALAAFLYQLWETQPGAVWMFAALVAGSILVQAALAVF